MRRTYFVFIMLFIATIANGQYSNNAIGLRLVGGEGLGTEISFQHNLTELNRVEFDLGSIPGNDYSAWALTGIYQWVWGINGDFNWYAGGGGKLGNWRPDDRNTTKDDGSFLFGVIGNIGIEYSLPSGIVLGFDVRPEIGLINHSNALRNNLAFSVRYRF